MENVNKNLNILNIDLISKFNLYKKKLLVKIKKIIVYVKLRSNDNDFLGNFFIFSKLIYFWLKQKIIIFFFKKEYLKGSRNNLLIYLGITLKKINNYKFLNYLKNVICKVSQNLDNTINFNLKNNKLLLNFSNLNYLIGLNINKYYRYSIKINILINFQNHINKNILKIYEKIFF